MTSDDRKLEGWMPLLVEKYKRDTEHLTTEQHGAYFLLLMAGWQREGLLPDNDGQLAAIAHLTPSRWRAHRSVLRPFFSPDGAGNLVQKRLLIEVERAKKLSVVRSEAGRLRSKPPAIAPANAQPIATAIAPPNALPIAPANAPAIGGAIAEQLGDYRGSPIPTSSVSDDPTHPTQEKEARASSSSRATPAGEACKAMKAAGIAEVNPSNPSLLTMLEQGATTQEFHFAAVKAVQANKGFAYALAIVKGAREDASRVALAPLPNGPALTGSARFLMAPGTPRVLPDDLPDLDLDDEPEGQHVDASQARG